jgi:hypothetical protein
MIRFFGGLRRTLLREGRTLAYLKYAVGELVLVVFGILIALQVNNWNEQRQLRAKADVALLETLQDLEQMVDRANDVIESAEDKDVILGRILAGKATAQDYRDDRNYVAVERNWEEMTPGVSHEGYDKLMRLADGVPAGYLPAIAALKSLYLRDVPTVQQTERFLADFVTRLLQRYGERHAWFSSGIDESYLQYVLHDPLYRNDIYSYRMYSSGNYLQSVRQLKYQAMLAYQAAHSVVAADAPVPAAMTEVRWLPEARLRRLEGRYRMPAASGSAASIAAITLRGGQLWLNGGTNTVCVLFMTTDDRFICLLLGGDAPRFRFSRDARGAVTGIDVLDGGKVKRHWPRLAGAQAPT